MIYVFFVSRREEQMHSVSQTHKRNTQVHIRKSHFEVVAFLGTHYIIRGVKEGTTGDQKGDQRQF